MNLDAWNRGWDAWLDLLGADVVPMENDPDFARGFRAAGEYRDQMRAGLDHSEARNDADT